VPLREGIIDMSAAFRALRAVGYDGWVSFEDFSTDEPLQVRMQDNLAWGRQLAADR
jgi:sugar phosphate isomerase/epimerase